MSAPLPSVGSRVVRRPATSGRLSADVKSGLSAALKWGIPGSDDFMLRVPSEARPAIQYLRSVAEPCAEYFGPQPALQWRLKRSAFAAVWRAAGKDLGT